MPQDRRVLAVVTSALQPLGEAGLRHAEFVESRPEPVRALRDARRGRQAHLIRVTHSAILLGRPASEVVASVARASRDLRADQHPRVLLNVRVMGQLVQPRRRGNRRAVVQHASQMQGEGVFSVDDGMLDAVSRRDAARKLRKEDAEAIAYALRCAGNLEDIHGLSAVWLR